jgi:hypothetical protein
VTKKRRGVASQIRPSTVAPPSAIYQKRTDTPHPLGEVVLTNPDKIFEKFGGFLLMDFLQPVLLYYSIFFPAIILVLVFANICLVYVLGKAEHW